MDYKLLFFNSATGQLHVQFSGMNPIVIDVPVEDGAFISGEALHNYVRGFVPTWYIERQRILAEEPLGADAVHALCDSIYTPTPPTYAEMRAGAYPPIADYMDAVVKGDQAAIDSYIARCLEVKAMYPKPEPVSAEVLRDRLGT